MKSVIKIMVVVVLFSFANTARAGIGDWVRTRWNRLFSKNAPVVPVDLEVARAQVRGAQRRAQKAAVRSEGAAKQAYDSGVASGDPDTMRLHATNSVRATNDARAASAQSALFSRMGVDLGKAVAVAAVARAHADGTSEGAAQAHRVVGLEQKRLAHTEVEHMATMRSLAAKGAPAEQLKVHAKAVVVARKTGEQLGTLRQGLPPVKSGRVQPAPAMRRAAH